MIRVLEAIDCFRKSINYALMRVESKSSDSDVPLRGKDEPTRCLSVVNLKTMY